MSIRRSVLVFALLVGCGPAKPDCSDPAPLAELGTPRQENPWLGKQRAVVLLAAWQDAPATHTVEEVEDAFFTGERSLARWFGEASSGAFELTGSVLPWRTLPSRWVDQDPREPGRIGAMARCVFEDALDIDGHDGDGNGRIDHLFVVHSGRLAQDRVGPRALFAGGRADRGVVLQSQGVGSVGSQVPIGFYLHEASHRYYGLKDRYGEHLHGRYGIGIWGLMGLGQWGPNAQIPRAEVNRYPVHPRARAKLRLGWARGRRIQADTRDVLLGPIETTGEVVRVVTGAEHDLVLEVRSATGFHAGLPGTGLLVWREPRNLAHPVVLIQADGRDDLEHGTDRGVRPLPPIDENFGDASDPYPGSLEVQSMTDSVTGVRLTRIRREGTSVRFDVDVPD